MSATETWAMDIDEMISRAIDDSNLVSEDDIHSQVEDALNSMDIPTRDEIVSEDDVTDLVSSAIYNGYIDVTDAVDADQLFDTYSFRSIVTECIDESDTLIGFQDRVNALEEVVTGGGSAEAENLTARVEYLEGVINCLVDAFGALGKSLNPNEVTFTKSEPVPAFKPTPQFIAEDAPYAAI